MSKIKEWLDSGLNKKSSLQSLKLLKEYLNVDSLESDWKNVKRADIHDMNGGNCFRTYLEKKVKNVGSRNTVLRQIERFFDFMIMDYASETGDFLDNPVIKKWDNFQVERVSGTYRQVISKENLRLLKKVLMEDDFLFVRNLGKDFIDGEFNPSRAVMIYLLLTLPLRSMQVRLLDSGLGDEERWDFENLCIVKNENGEKGRSFGFIQTMYYSGLSKEKNLCLYVNTNKNSKGFYVPYMNNEILEMAGKQINFVKRFSSVVYKDKEKIHPLFLDNCGNVVSRESLMKLWKKLCKEVYKIYGVKVESDLHTLRVSLITHSMELFKEEKFVGSNWSGQTGDIVGHYYRVDDIRSIVKEKEKNGKLIGSEIKLLN